MLLLFDYQIIFLVVKVFEVLIFNYYSKVGNFIVKR